jgi:signal transduction histidine kinase
MRKNRRISGIQILVKDVTEKKIAEEMLRKKSEELKRLSEQLINAQEAERIKISRELHDELGQSLTMLRLSLAGIERELPSGNSSGIKAGLAEADALAENLLSHIHELILEMRPSLLDDLGLVPTLRWYVDKFSRKSKIKVRIDVADFHSRISPEIETAVYRVVQEALTNVARHARARNVTIELKKRKTRIEVSIKDDGIGMDGKRLDRCPAKDGGVGILGMRERVVNLDGNLSINSQPGVGTCVEISLPLREYR